MRCACKSEDLPPCCGRPGPCPGRSYQLVTSRQGDSHADSHSTHVVLVSCSCPQYIVICSRHRVFLGPCRRYIPIAVLRRDANGPLPMACCRPRAVVLGWPVPGAGNSQSIDGGNGMEKNETAFVKQSLMATKDWDLFQVLLRKCRAIMTSGKSTAPAKR